MLVQAQPEYALLFEPIRAYYQTMIEAGITDWRPYITFPPGFGRRIASPGTGVTKAQRAAFKAQRVAFTHVFDGSMAARETGQRGMSHTSVAEVAKAEALVVKMVRGLMSLRWMIEEFQPRHTFVIIRNPQDAIASQVRVNALRGTPKDPEQLSIFWAKHPEITPFTPKSGVEWLALWWAASYHAALSAPKPHPWSLVRYEDLVGDAEAVQRLIFDPLDLKPGPLEMRNFVHTPSFQTKHGRPTKMWTPKAGRRRLTVADVAAIDEVLERFPLLKGTYAPH